jgi:hypothetical protein
MAFRKFGPNDVNINTMKAHPKSEFVIYDGDVYYNNSAVHSGNWVGNITELEPGFISLYEYNIDRTAGIFGSGSGAREYLLNDGKNPLIFPFISKDSSRISIQSAIGGISTTVFNNEFAYGDQLSGAYPQYASITREPIDTPSALPFSEKMSFVSLENTLNLYGVNSQHYVVSSSAYGDKTDQFLNLIHIPSIFYGTKIKPGTICLRMYHTGTLIGECRDTKENGELIQTYGQWYVPVAGDWIDNTDSVAGVALYDEGFLLLTGSWPLDDTGIGAISPGPARQFPRWIYFGAGSNDGIADASYTGGGASRFDDISFSLSFEGQTDTQIVTMIAHAKRGQANFSHNPTFLEKNQEQLYYTSSHVYEENPSRTIKNTVSSSYSDYSASFKRQVYISKIGVYDSDKNLIGIASLADPVLKEEDEDLTFKIKLDI